MRTNNLKAILKAALRVVCILPFAAVVAFGQQTVNLTAGPATATLPDGSAVPMWGYSCGTAVVGSTATCAKLNPAAGDPHEQSADCPSFVDHRWSVGRRPRNFGNPHAEPEPRCPDPHMAGL